MKKQESGRSMVEMLGVLAVIGVLSIAAIAGFTLAMNRYRANNLLDKATKFAALAYSTKLTSEARGKTFNPASFEFENQKLGSLQEGEELTLGTDAISATGVVTVVTTFANQEICRMAKNILGEQDDCSSGGVTTLKFKQK